MTNDRIFAVNATTTVVCIVNIWLAAAWGWKWSFVVTGALLLALAGLAWRHMHIAAIEAAHVKALMDEAAADAEDAQGRTWTWVERAIREGE